MSTIDRLPLVIFCGPVAPNEPERWVDLACRANTVDLIDRARRVPAIDPIVVVTPADPVWSAELAQLGAEVVPDAAGEPFHFGRALQSAVARLALPRFLYIGGGAGVLLTSEALAALVERALRLERGVLANNLYSADLLALAPASALTAIDPPPTDNDLAWRLAAAGLPLETLPATAATRLDLDAPNDVAVATLHPDCGPALRRLAASLPLPMDHLQRLLAELESPQGEVLVYGRLAAATWAQLERLPCQTRAFSEERGMRASGRLARGEVYAWLGAFLECAGPRRFFHSLARACTAAILDTRVLFAHQRISPSPADRFNSDLLQPERIAQPAVRAFTQEALDAPLPILLGGQSLVSGGLLALAEAATPTLR